MPAAKMMVKIMVLTLHSSDVTRDSTNTSFRVLMMPMEAGTQAYWLFSPDPNNIICGIV